VIYEGACYRARCDTARDPTYVGDWVCIAAAGRNGVDGITPIVRGTFKASETYQRLDIVAYNKGSFIARQDDPGPCPGDGWQLLTSYGKRGERGEQGPRGERGPQGERGERAPSIVSWRIDRASYLAVPVMSDGLEGPALQLRSLFEEYNEAARG
jgi:hypothetical protein